MKLYVSCLDDCDMVEYYELTDWFSSDKIEDLLIALKDKVQNLMWSEQIRNYKNENGLVFGDEIRIASFWWTVPNEFEDDTCLITLKRNY